jgi:hypothetical protein
MSKIDTAIQTYKKAAQAINSTPHTSKTIGGAFGVLLPYVLHSFEVLNEPSYLIYGASFVLFCGVGYYLDVLQKKWIDNA